MKHCAIRTAKSCAVNETAFWNCSKIFLLVWIVFIISFQYGFVAADPLPVTVSYSGADPEIHTITVEFDENWFLQPDDVYNHKLMQASFGLEVSSFRSKAHDLSEKDHNVLDFYKQAGFVEPRSDDYHIQTSINTIATAIAYKPLGEETILAVAISGANYQNEWLSNFTIDDEYRAEGFNKAADIVMDRLENYIEAHQLTGKLRLWTVGYSRSAAVANIFAADAVDTQRFEGVYAYTFATPRTNREANPDRYHNIFNFIIPFDAVPMVPLPEWGFARYGIDLYLPSLETDSQFVKKFMAANELSNAGFGTPLIINPRINRELHTVFDYIAFFINSVGSYQRTYQNLLINFWTNKSPGKLIRDIFERISITGIWKEFLKRNAEFRYQFHEFYNFLDYNTQIIYTSLLERKEGNDSEYWDNSLTLQQNIAYNHYDNTYRYWLFSSNDPDEILTKDPEYVHYAILGNVDVEIYDQNGAFIQQIDKTGSYIFSTSNLHYPDFQGEISDTLLYAERHGNQTLIVLPEDQIFTIYIYSNEHQDIRVSYVELSAERFRGNVCYVYYDEYDAGEGFAEVIDPDVDRNLTKEELQAMGVMVTEPWSNDIVYSPTAVMRLENSHVFHPSPIFFLIFILVLLVAIIAFLLFIFKKIIKGLKKVFRGSIEKKTARPRS